MQHEVWPIFHSLWLISKTDFTLLDNNIINIPTLYDFFLLVICQLAEKEQQELPINDLI